MLLEAIIFVITLSILSAIWWYASVPKNLPPGPKGLPFLGCVVESRRKPPHLLLEQWTKEYGPVVSFYMGSQLVILLGNYEAIETALVKQAEFFSGRPDGVFHPMGEKNQKAGIIATDGEVWKEQRRFALSTLRDFGFGKPILQTKITEEIEYLLNDISQENGRPFNIQMALNKAVSNVIGSMVFGHRFEDPEFWRSLERLNFRVSQAQVTIMTPIFYFDWIRRLILTVMKIKSSKLVREGLEHMQYLKKIIAQTSSTFNPSDSPANYVHAFLKAKNDNVGHSFTDDQLLLSVHQLFAAGSETTSTTLRWAVFLMAKHPRIQEKIFKEISDTVGTDQLPTWEDRTKLPYTEAALMEIQRIANLVPLSLTHRTTGATKLMGYDIPADAFVIPLLWNVLKDPKYFPNPDNFEPDRFLDTNNKIKKEQAFIPFSAGKRICLGESLAKMELFLYFTAMITRFRFSFTEGKPEPPINRICGITMTPASFDICAKKRQDS